MDPILEGYGCQIGTRQERDFVLDESDYTNLNRVVTFVPVAEILTDDIYNVLFRISYRRKEIKRRRLLLSTSAII